MPPAGKTFCPDCKTMKKNAEFYRSNNSEKYPTGRLPICKTCRAMMVNNWDSSTFEDILEECDVPYIPQEWNKLLETYGQNPEKCSGTSILGRYLSKMQLQQFNKYRWNDTERIQTELADEIRASMESQGFEENVILQAIEDNKKLLPGPGVFLGELQPTVPKFAERPVIEEESATVNQDGTVNNPEALPDYFADMFEDDVSYENDLTDDDKKYLRLKWGKTYNTDELIRLEKLYREMEESFDIQNAGHRDTLIKACKTSLKADQLLDIGDVDGAQKMVKMYETLMKIGKFTAVQNKTEQGECLESISELTLLCEKQGFIPRY